MKVNSSGFNWKIDKSTNRLELPLYIRDNKGNITGKIERVKIPAHLLERRRQS
ncbi:hypothetical protein [Oceanobacillus kimchii]|uniref:hypothetical protein n=1 Tax=Oceanobacillus kimchii TaxID=746691 RepID=UPI003C7278E3